MRVVLRGECGAFLVLVGLTIYRRPITDLGEILVFKWLVCWSRRPLLNKRGSCSALQEIWSNDDVGADSFQGEEDKTLG